MSPIFVRPVREQLEHDRLIRHLVTKFKRKFDAVGNAGDEQVAPVKLGATTYYPDVVLMEGKKLAGVIEVETAESVNNLEAMAQWVPFSRSRVPFQLYVPVNAYDVAKRFCESHQAAVSEIWTYRPAADGFDLVRSFHDATATTRKSPGRVVASIPPKPTPPPPPPPAPVAPAKPAAAKPAAAKPAIAKPAGKPEAKPAAKLEAKATGKPQAKPIARLEAKPAVKPDVRPTAKPEVKPTAKVDVKAAKKPEVKPAKPVAKAAAKPAPKPAAAKAVAKPAAKKPAKGKAAPGRKK